MGQTKGGGRKRNTCGLTVTNWALYTQNLFILPHITFPFFCYEAERGKMNNTPLFLVSHFFLLWLVWTNSNEEWIFPKEDLCQIHHKLGWRGGIKNVFNECIYQPDINSIHWPQLWDEVNTEWLFQIHESDDTRQTSIIKTPRYKFKYDYKHLWAQRSVIFMGGEKKCRYLNSITPPKFSNYTFWKINSWTKKLVNSVNKIQYYHSHSITVLDIFINWRQCPQN